MRFPRIFKAFCLVAAMVFAQFAALQNLADAADRTVWVTGTELQRRLAEPVDILWTGNPLRDALQNLAKAKQTAILIDRRVDPEQKLDIALNGVPLQAALQTIAERNREIGVARLGDVIYVGPANVAQNIRAIEGSLKTRLRQLPPPIQKKFFQSKPLAWDDLASPRDLLTQLARQNDFEIANLKEVPHDLWAAADLPSLSLLDRLLLISVQYDKTLSIDADGKRLTLVDVPEDLPEAAASVAESSVTRPHNKPSVGNSPTNLERLRIQRIAIQDERLGSILPQLAKRLGLELRMDEEALKKAGVSLDQRVTLTLENVSVDQLFDRLLDSTGLTAQRRDQVITISPEK